MHKKTYTRAFVGLFVLCIALIALDLIVKHFVDVYLSPVGTSVPFIGGILNLTNVHNTGAAFGMFQNAGWMLAAARIITSGALLFLMIRFHRRLYPFLSVVLTVILAGAAGNLIDQVAWGYVRDMFEFAFVNFAVFNMADTYVTVGSALLFAHVLFTKKGRALLDLVLETKSQKTIKSGQMENNNG